MSGPAPHVFGFGSFRLDLGDRLLTRQGQPLRLNPKEFETLRVLVENAGHLVPKEKFIAEIWPDSFVTDSSLTRNISMLRKALGEEFIETVPRVGYRFTGVVKQLDSVDSVSTEVIQHGRTPGIPPPDGSGLEAGVGLAADGYVKPGAHQPGIRILRVAVFGISLIICAVAGVYLLHRLTAPGTLAPRIVPLTALPGSETDAAFSPRGDRVVFSWNGGTSRIFHLYVKAIGSGPPLRLTSGPGSDSSPMWSPDGQQIAFLRQVAGTPDGVFLVPAAGGPERRLGNAQMRAEYSYTDKNLDWSPDGKSLAIMGRSSGHEPCRIKLLDLRTGEQRPLTSPPATYIGDSNPAWSPDGKTLAFIRMANTIVSDVYLQPANGGGPRRLTWDDRLIGGLCWSADGREIIYSSNRGGLFTLWRVATSHPEAHPLPAVGTDTYAPAISRNGQRLAYTHWFAPTDIWETAGSGSKPDSAVRLISSARAEDSPQFSPDGRRIVFASDRSGSAEIWVCDADGSHPVQLTFFGGPATGTPRWSPDGREIAFDSRPRGHSSIYLVRSEGGTPSIMASGNWDDVMPSWSRDGKWIYYGSNRTGDRQLWKTPRAGGDSVQVTRQGGFEGFESSDSREIYYSKHGTPGIWRMDVADGQESLILDRNVGRHWTLTDGEILFIDPSSSPRPLIQLLAFNTGRITTVGALEHQLGTTPGLAVSPDRSRILYAQADHVESNIVLVENFR